MDNTTNNQIRMIRTAKQNLADFKESSWTGIVVIQKYYDQLTDSVKEIDFQENILAAMDTGPAKKKRILRGLMIHSALGISGSAYSYADDISDTTLKENMNIRRSDFPKLSDAEQANKAEMIFNVLSPIVALVPNPLKDYMVEQPNLDDLKTRFTDYRNYLNAPKLNINAGSEARDIIRKEVKKSIAILEKLDRIIENFHQSDPEFYEMYFKSRIILDLGKRYRKPISFISGKVIHFETEESIVGVNIYFVGFEKKCVLSDNDGLYNLGAYKEGELLLIAEKEGFSKYEEVIIIKKGEDQEFNIELEPLPATPPPDEPPV